MCDEKRERMKCEGEGKGERKEKNKKSKKVCDGCEEERCFVWLRECAEGREKKRKEVCQA